MLRDGQFLAEKPVAISGGWAPKFGRDDYTDDELFMQRAILNDKPRLRLPILSVGMWLFAVFFVFHLTVWLFH